jgi:hypothetical protein
MLKMKMSRQPKRKKEKMPILTVEQKAITRSP